MGFIIGFVLGALLIAGAIWFSLRGAADRRGPGEPHGWSDTNYSSHTPPGDDI